MATNIQRSKMLYKRWASTLRKTRPGQLKCCFIFRSIASDNNLYFISLPVRIFPGGLEAACTKVEIQFVLKIEFSGRFRPFK